MNLSYALAIKSSAAARVRVLHIDTLSGRPINCLLPLDSDSNAYPAALMPLQLQTPE